MNLASRHARLHAVWTSFRSLLRGRQRRLRREREWCAARIERLENRVLLASDLGDAPAPYPTLLTENGAEHTAAGPTLGINRDAEANGTHSGNADADDTTGTPDDEDGIMLPTALGCSGIGSVTINLQSPNAVSNRLDAWIDFNRDGDWSDAGEQVATSLNLGTTAGPRTLSFTIPAGTVAGETYARFRLSTAGGLAPTGAAGDGEVEDYRLTIHDLPAITRLYRAYNPNANFHFFTTSFVQFANAVNAGYRDEASGNEGFSVFPVPEANSTPIFRLYNLQAGFHYYTLSAAERDSLVAIVPPPTSGPDNRTTGWRDEGIEGYTYSAPLPCATPVYRLYNTDSGVHLFTHSPTVRDAVLGITNSVTGQRPWQRHSDLGYAIAVSASNQVIDPESFSGVSVLPSSGLATDENGGTATFTVKLDSQPTANVTIPIASSDTTEGTIFVSNLVFTPANWNQPQTVTVTGVDDTVVDGDISYRAILSAAISADPKYQGLDALDVQLINRDNDLRTLSISDVSKNEGNSGTTNFDFIVTLSGPSSQAVTVSYATANGSAAAGSDYTANSGTLTFNPGETSKTITVSVTGDTTVEGNETFVVNLSSPANAAIARGQGIGTIVNDDTAPIGNVSGIWRGTQSARIGPYNLSGSLEFNLTQAGNSLFGTVTLSGSTQNINSSSVDGNRVVIRLTAGTFDWTWDGTVNGTTMSGSVSVYNRADGASGGGTFTVTRQAAASTASAPAVLIVPPVTAQAVSRDGDIAKTALDDFWETFGAGDSTVQESWDVFERPMCLCFAMRGRPNGAPRAM